MRVVGGVLLVERVRLAEAPVAAQVLVGALALGLRPGLLQRDQLDEVRSARSFEAASGGEAVRGLGSEVAVPIHDQLQVVGRGQPS